MNSFAWRAARLLTLASLLWLTVGCGSDEALLVRDWTLGARSVRLPTHLTGLEQPGRYRLAARVALPEHLQDRDLTFGIPLFHGRATLTADGVRALPLEAADDGAYRAVGPQNWRIPRSVTEDGVLQLELEVDHLWEQSAWLDSVPRLSADLTGDSGFRIRRALYLLGAWGALATLLSIGFTYFAVFLFDRRRTAHGWFALGTLTAAVYPLFNLGLTRVLGTLDVAVLGVALAMAPVATIRFTHVQFELGPTPRWITALPLAVAVPALFWHQPFVATSRLAPLALGVVAVALVYALVALARLVRKPASSINARIILACWILLAVSIANDAAAWLGFGDVLDGARTGGLGLMAFALLQSIALSREHGLAVRRAEGLNVELSARVRQLERRQHEIVRLNEELRRQIAERSRDLANLLSGLEHGPAHAAALAPGSLVAERYRVGRELGAGGMGRVYEVERLADGQRFAMKIMRGRVDAARAVRFAREAELISEIDHPNVVRVVDVGVDACGFLFLVMERVHGSSLRDCGDRYGDVRWAVRVLHQLAEALAEIHRNGIVHRDVKPGNVLVSGAPDEPLVKLTDFGIATITEIDQDELVTMATARNLAPDGTRTENIVPPHRTETGVLLGTPLYMAPELGFGVRNATAAADVFAFGVIAHELLAGRRPFIEPPVTAFQRGAYQPPERLSRDVPALLGELVLACLAAHAADRPRSDELVSALADECAGSARATARHEVQISHNSSS